MAVGFTSVESDNRRSNPSTLPDPEPHPVGFTPCRIHTLSDSQEPLWIRTAPLWIRPEPLLNPKTNLIRTPMNDPAVRTPVRQLVGGPHDARHAHAPLERAPVRRGGCSNPDRALGAASHVPCARLAPPLLLRPELIRAHQAHQVHISGSSELIRAHQSSSGSS
eukprot:911426-Prymnesium_polylepis.1